MDLPIGALLLLGLVVLWWRASLQARDIARDAARRFCRRQTWQLLDQTVTLVGLWPHRGLQRLGLRWRYRFDYSPDGALRLQGHITLLGHRVSEIRALRADGTQLVDVVSKST